MFSELIQTPEFSTPLPRWGTTACLAVSLLLIALLVDRPAQNNVGPSATVAITNANR